MKPHIVLMLKPSRLGRHLSVNSQIKEVFGPFATGQEAKAWTERAEQLVHKRNWLIIPLNHPSLLNAIDPAVN